jgi:hypothetical protein
MGSMATTDHLPSEVEIREWPPFTCENPLTILASACLWGVPSGVDGSSYGAPPLTRNAYLNFLGPQ